MERAGSGGNIGSILDRGFGMLKKRLRSMALYIIFAVLGTYLTLAAVLFVFQSHFVYFPQRELISSPHDVGLRYDAIRLKTDDGLELNAWFVPVEKPRGVVLFCHGNAGNMADRMQAIQILAKLNLSTFIFDYRGFGKSEGKTSEKGTYLDAVAAWDYLVQNRGIDPDRIIILGESLGGAVAAWLAQEHKPAGLIIESSFTSLPDVAADLYPFFPVRAMLRFSYNTADYLSRVESPVLIVHSCDDDIIPFAHGCQLYDVARAPKEFLEIRGDHNTGFIMSGESYVEGIDAFVSKYLKGKPDARRSSGRDHAG